MKKEKEDLRLYTRFRLPLLGLMLLLAVAGVVVAVLLDHWLR